MPLACAVTWLLVTSNTVRQEKKSYKSLQRMKDQTFSTVRQEKKPYKSLQRMKGQTFITFLKLRGIIKIKCKILQVKLISTT